MHIGKLIAFEAGTYRATVELRGSVAARLRVAVSRAVPAGEMLAGRRVAVWFGGAGDDPSEAVVLAVW